MDGLCHLNGRILPLSEARIHPLDRGFVFGDALYEVVRVRSGVLLDADAHLRRLANGLERVGIPRPTGLATACRELVAAAGLVSGSVYLQVTRGVAPRSHRPPEGTEPTVFILPSSHAHDRPAGRRLRAITVDDRRWGNCDVKTTSLMATVLARRAAAEAEVDEVLFVGPAGELREGGQTSLLVRIGDRWLSHPQDRHVLPGVTRDLLVRFAVDEGMPIDESAPRLAGLDDWREALLCGTLTGVQPLVEIDGRRIAGGDAGDWTRRLAERVDRHERDQAASAADTALPAPGS